MMKNYFFVLTRPPVLSTFVIAMMVAAGGSVFAQQFNPNLFKPLHWRSIGPFRGGRTRAVAGVPSQPNVFYIAQVNGGISKTVDSCRKWEALLGDQPAGSLGWTSAPPVDVTIRYLR